MIVTGEDLGVTAVRTMPVGVQIFVFLDGHFVPAAWAVDMPDYLFIHVPPNDGGPVRPRPGDALPAS